MGEQGLAYGTDLRMERREREEKTRSYHGIDGTHQRAVIALQDDT